MHVWIVSTWEEIREWMAESATRSGRPVFCVAFGSPFSAPEAAVPDLLPTQAPHKLFCGFSRPILGQANFNTFRAQKWPHYKLDRGKRFSDPAQLDAFTLYYGRSQSYEVDLASRRLAALIKRKARLGATWLASGADRSPIKNARISPQAVALFDSKEAKLSIDGHEVAPCPLE